MSINIKTNAKANVQTNAKVMAKAKCFTLTELLVALAIIGVISVMVLPSILQKIERRKVETALPKFYTTMNTALRMSEANDGACNYAGLDKFRRPKELPQGSLSYDNNLEVLNNCFLPNLKYSKVEKCDETSNSVCVYFMNGEHFEFYVNPNGGEIIYCIYSDPKKCIMGKSAFMFEYLRLVDFYQYFSTPRPEKTVEPYRGGLYGSRTETSWDLNWSCRNGKQMLFCTSLLKKNNWKFPKNYPTKF